MSASLGNRRAHTRGAAERKPRHRHRPPSARTAFLDTPPGAAAAFRAARAAAPASRRGAWRARTIFSAVERPASRGPVERHRAGDVAGHQRVDVALVADRPSARRAAGMVEADARGRSRARGPWRSRAPRRRRPGAVRPGDLGIEADRRAGQRRDAALPPRRARRWRRRRPRRSPWAPIRMSGASPGAAAAEAHVRRAAPRWRRRPPRSPPAAPGSPVQAAAIVGHRRQRAAVDRVGKGTGRSWRSRR